jgi:transposase
LRKNGYHIVSVDECTGIQALERLAPTLPQKPGKKICVESDYCRHGTCCLIAGLEIASGEIIHHYIGPTRTEKDLVAYLTAMIDIDPTGKWVFIMDNLNTHIGEGLVRLVADRCAITTELGIKGKIGILKSKVSRQAFLHDSSHRIRMVYTPKHCSWLNQIELWFGRLRRKLLKRGEFASLEALIAKLHEYIANYNRIYAHPYRWTWAGVPLVMA